MIFWSASQFLWKPLVVIPKRGVPRRPLATFLWLMFAAGREGLRGYRRDRREGGNCGDLYFTTFLAVVVFNLAGLFEANWRDTEVSRLMLFLIAIPWLLKSADSGAADQALQSAAD